MTVEANGEHKTMSTPKDNSEPLAASEAFCCGCERALSEGAQKYVCDECGTECCTACSENYGATGVICISCAADTQTCVDILCDSMSQQNVPDETREHKTLNNAGIGAPPVQRPLHIRKRLDQLAWDIGRDDRMYGVPPFVRSRNYRPDKRTWYRRGYVAQCRDQPAIVNCPNT